MYDKYIKLIDENKRLKLALKKAYDIIEILDSKIVLYQIKEDFGVDEEQLSCFLGECISSKRISKNDINNHNIWKYYAQEMRMKSPRKTKDDDIELGKRILQMAGIY